MVGETRRLAKKMDEAAIKTELYAALDRPNGWQAIQHLVRKLRKCETTILRDALLSVFEDESPERFAAQEVAGGILWLLRPPYDRDISSDLNRLLPNWDVSVEELPWYLAEAAGIDAVRTAAKARLVAELSDDTKKRLETVLFWLGVGDPSAFRSELDNRWHNKLKG